MKGAGMDEVSREAEEWLGAFARVAKKLGSEPSPAEARGLLGMLEVVSNSLEMDRAAEQRIAGRTGSNSSERLAPLAA